MSENKKIKLFDDNEMIQWAYQNDCLNTLTTFTNAAKTGNIKALEWAHSKKYPCDESVVYTAIQYGQLEAFKWLCNNGYESEKYKCRETAGEYCQLRMLKFFLEEDKNQTVSNNKDPYLCLWNKKYFYEFASDTWDGVTWAKAASSGHLEVLTWVYKNKISNFNHYTILAAAENNKMHIIKWLLDINPQIVSYYSAETLLCHIVKFGNIDDIQWLLNHNIKPGSRTLYNTKNLELMKILHKNGAYIDPLTMYKAAVRGDIDVIRWGMENGFHYDKNIFSAAVANDQTTVFNYLLSINYLSEKYEYNLYNKEIAATT